MKIAWGNIFLVLIVIACCAGYVGLRFSALPNLESDTISTLRTLPAFYCDFAAPSFEGSQTGRVYQWKGQIRTDLIDSSADFGTYGGHQLMNVSGVNYIWVEGVSTAWPDMLGNAVFDKTFADALASRRSAFNSTCKPWWFPTSSRFVFPEGIELGDAPEV